MTGNVWEWLQDCYEMPYAGDAPTDGSAYINAECERRGVRGGSWISTLVWQRPTFRGRDPESLTSRIFGLRVARDLPQ
jgi:formylglycine-generating enzyme required for sulfatase activity